MIVCFHTDGKTKSYYENDKEFALLILSGKCTVCGKDFKYENIGERELSTEELEEKIATGEMNHPLQIAAYFKYKLSKF